MQSKLLWLPLVALKAGESIADDVKVDPFLRQLQFRVASTLDSDTLPEICERWMEDTQRVPHSEARSMMSGIMWFSFGFSQSLKVPLKHRLRAIASIETLSSELQDLHRQRTTALLRRPEIVEAGIPTTATTAQMIFLFANRSIRDSASLEQLLQWLDEDATELLRTEFEALLEWPITQAVGAFVQSAWAARHEETRDWGLWIRLLEKIDDYAKRRASPRFGREAAKARAIILTEYLERSNDALAVLDQAVRDFGPSPVLLEQRANVFSYKQDDERVLGIWTQLVADPASKAALDMFAYRRAGISAARLKRWNDAEQIFQDAITSIPPGQFGHTKFGLQLDAALVASLKNNQSRASEIQTKAVLSLPPEAAVEGDLRWDAVNRIAVEVCKTIESSFWKHEQFDPRVKVGDASSPNLKSHKVEPGQAARYELMRVQVLHLAATLGVDHPSITEAIEQLANSGYVYVRWLAAEARLALAYANGADTGFIRALVSLEKSYADLSGKRGKLSPLSPDQGPASNLPIAPHEWFGLLAAGSICADNLLSSLNSWLNESIQEVGSGTPLTGAIRSMIEGASMETDQLEITIRTASNPTALRCGAAARLLCSGLDASKTLQLQAFLTSALMSDKSFARQDLFNLYVARRFAKPWRAHAENRFQFSCPRTTVPQLLNTVDGVTKGTYTLKDLLQSAGSALGQPLGDFMELVR